MAAIPLNCICVRFICEFELLLQCVWFPDSYSVLFVCTRCCVALVIVCCLEAVNHRVASVIFSHLRLFASGFLALCAFYGRCLRVSDYRSLPFVRAHRDSMILCLTAASVLINCRSCRVSAINDVGGFGLCLAVIRSASTQLLTDLQAVFLSHRGCPLLVFFQLLHRPVFFLLFFVTNARRTLR